MGPLLGTDHIDWNTVVYGYRTKEPCRLCGLPSTSYYIAVSTMYESRCTVVIQAPCGCFFSGRAAPETITALALASGV